MGESLAMLRGRRFVTRECTHGRPRATESPSNEHHLPGDRAIAPEQLLRARSPQHRNCDGQRGAAREIATNDAHAGGARELRHAVGKLECLRPPRIGERHSDRHTERRGPHRGEITHRGGSGAIPDFLRGQPLALEVHELHRGIGAHHQLFAGGYINNGRVVARALGERAPARKQCAHQVELRAGAQGDVRH